MSAGGQLSAARPSARTMSREKTRAGKMTAMIGFVGAGIGTDQI